MIFISSNCFAFCCRFAAQRFSSIGYYLYYIQDNYVAITRRRSRSYLFRGHKTRVWSCYVHGGKIERMYHRVNFVLESVHTSRRTSLEMIFLCLVRMYVHSMDSNVLWTMTLRRWRRASKTSPRHHQHRHGTRRHDLEAWMGHLPQIGHRPD